MRWRDGGRMGVGVGNEGIQGESRFVCHTHTPTHTHTCPHLQRWKRDVRRGRLFNSTSNTHIPEMYRLGYTICQRCPVSGCEMMLCDTR